MFEDLAQETARMLRGALDQGFLLPLYVAAVAVNGSAVSSRYDALENAPGLAPTFLCEHMSGPGFVLPINLMIVDQTWRAAHLVINPLARQ